MVTPGGRESKPRRKLQQFGEYIFVQLQIGKFTFAPKSTDIDLVGWQILRVSVNSNSALGMIIKPTKQWWISYYYNNMYVDNLEGSPRYIVRYLWIGAASIFND